MIPKLLELAAKVRYELDPTIDYPRHFYGHVKVKMNDGTVLEENQPHPRGGFEDPLPPERDRRKVSRQCQLGFAGAATLTKFLARSNGSSSCRR